jgi:tetratricopeptide (TPR) repeat protein
LLAERHEADEEWERAIRCYLIAIEQAPSDLESYYRLARLYARLGKEYVNLDLLDEAGKVGRAGRRRAANDIEWYRKFEALLGTLQADWEAAGGRFEDVDDQEG